MSGLFAGLEIGKSALSTNQLWLNIIGHNIANVNTDGYTRQRVTTTTSNPYDHAVGPVGTGVTSVNVNHVRDLFLNQQYRQDSKELGRWDYMNKTLSQIESLFDEPSDDSLGSLITQFWDSWSDLANNPEDSGYRNSLIENSNLLTSSFHRIYDQLTTLRDNVDDEIALSVDAINLRTDEIASLNAQISRAELGGENANDLRDKRDLLIDELSEYVDVNTLEMANGQTTVYIGAMAVVDGISSFHIDTTEVSADNTSVNQIVWEGTKRSIKISNGQLKGAIDLRDSVIPEYLDALDDMAAALVTGVNAVHRTGYSLDGSTTGLNFFSSIRTSASNICLSSNIIDDINNIAASLSGEVGDNRNALTISDLRNSLLMSRGTMTMSGFYQSLIGKIGTDTSQSTNLKEDYELLVAQTENSRQSVQGVSLDEETAQMIKYQNAYDAAARLITVMDEALDTVINGMGIVGR